MALDLKKKAGPLPVWGWIVVGTGVLGVLYYLHARSSSSSSATPANDASLAGEEAALNGTSGDSDGGIGGSGVLTAPAATGTVTTDQLDSDLQTIQAEISAFSQTPATDPSAQPTIAQEASDLLAAQSALQSLGAGGTSTGAGQGTPAANAKSVAGLPIIQQLQDLQEGLVTKAALGSGASAALAAAGGNVAKAIATRPAVATPSTAPVTRATPPATITKSAAAKQEKIGTNQSGKNSIKNA